MTTTSMVRFFRKVESTPGFFDKDTEYALIDIAKGEGRQADKAMNILVHRNFGIIHSAAKRILDQDDHDDAVSAGVQGFIAAVRGFDSSKSGRLSTLATIMVKQYIRRYIFSTSRAIRLPEYIHVNLNKVSKAWAAHIKSHGVEPTDLEIDAYNEWTPGTTLALRSYRDASVCSLSAPLAFTEGLTVGDIIPSDKYLPEVDLMATNDVETLERLLSTLQPRHRQVVELTFGLDGNDKHTGAEISAIIGVSKQRVHQILQAAIRELGVRNGSV